MVSTLRCGRSNPGSNPGHGSIENAGQAMETFCACFSVNPDSLLNWQCFLKFKTSCLQCRSNCKLHKIELGFQIGTLLSDKFVLILHEVFSSEKLKNFYVLALNYFHSQ